MPTDKNPLIISNFKGLLQTDITALLKGTGFTAFSSSDDVPFDRALECDNLNFLKKGSIHPRFGVDEYKNLAVTGIPTQIWKIDNLKGIPRLDKWLILAVNPDDPIAGTNTGRFYDTGVTGPATNPILTIQNCTYASVINAFGRMYISPWSAWLVPTNLVYVYNGDYNGRECGYYGLNVGGGMGVAAAAGGTCTVGVHLLGVQFETDTGFRTALYGALGGPVYTVTTTAANAKISLTTIPVGAAGRGIVKRHIIMTKIVVNNNGRGFLSYEPFIALTINDNTTVAATIDIPDSGLVDSAKDFTAQENVDDRIRGCISLATYGSRMVYCGTVYGGGNFIAVSPPNQPEQLANAASAGLLPVSCILTGQHFSGQVIAGAELNGTFYIFKDDSTWSTVANDELDPVEWPAPALVDGGKGAFPFGVAKMGNNPTAPLENALIVAGNHGISLFNGKFADRSLAEGIWEYVGLSDLIYAKVFIEPIRQLIFVQVGDPFSSTLYSWPGTKNKILVGNYYEGMSADTIKWGTFSFGNNGPNTGAVIIRDVALRPPGTPAGIAYFNTFYSLLAPLTGKATGGATYTAYILSEDTDRKDWKNTSGGASAAYPSWAYRFGFTPNEAGEVYTFGPLKLRIITSGESGIKVEAVIIDQSTLETVETFTITATPKRYASLNLNKTAEQIGLRLSGQVDMILRKLVLYGAKSAIERPRL